ncbi:MAG: DinB family protein [Flavobacteriales bacterium]|nr:DinB family protein [Flavobacteriales bacterium]
MSIKPLIDQLAGYNRWANTRFVERLQTEPEAVLDRSVASSFPTLRDTLLHIRDAENAWMHRLEGIAPVPWPAEEDRAISTLVTYSTRLEDLLSNANEEWLLSTAAYHDLRGNRHEQVRWQMVLHCINHGTQHRGQLITMMRGLGLASIPPNDMVVYQRSSL